MTLLAGRQPLFPHVVGGELHGVSLCLAGSVVLVVAANLQNSKQCSEEEGLGSCLTKLVDVMDIIMDSALNLEYAAT